MNCKVAVLGTPETLFVFRQIGMDCFLAERGEEALSRQIRRLAKADYVLFFVDEDRLAEAPGIAGMFDSDPRIAVIPVPGIGSGSVGAARINELAEKALGRKIL